MEAVVVARKILQIAQENGDVVTHLKLQKLLYYAQVWYMVNNNGEKLFLDEMQAQPLGPVVPSVYEKYRRYEWHPILCDDMHIDIDDNKETFLQEFCQQFLGHSATELVAMTHNELPWQEACKKGKNATIDCNTMYSFYSKMLEESQVSDA